MFVGADAYVAAGGAILRDLFDTENEGYLSDQALVTRLANDKLDAAVETVQAEGWKWVKAELERDYSTRSERVWPEEQEDEDADPVFAPQDMQRAGAILRIGRDGSLTIERGFIHPNDQERGETEAAPKVLKDPTALAASMVQELGAHRTAALRIELCRNQDVALSATVHALVMPVLYDNFAATCLELCQSRVDGKAGSYQVGLRRP